MRIVEENEKKESIIMGVKIIFRNLVACELTFFNYLHGSLRVTGIKTTGRVKIFNERCILERGHRCTMNYGTRITARFFCLSTPEYE